MKILASIGRAWRFLPPRLRDRYHRLPLPLRKFLNRTLLDETPQLVAVQSGLLAGAHLYISPRLESGYYLGTWELEVQEMLAHFVRPGMKVFDIGANIGFFALALARLVGTEGLVVAFEPNPFVVPRLRKTIELNHLTNVQIEEIAAAEFDGQAYFSVSLTQAQGRFADLPYVPSDGDMIDVRCRTVDSYVVSTGIVPDVLLIDVEHAEGRVLRGMQQLLSTRKPLIVIEMHGPEAIAEAVSALQQHSYSFMSADLKRIAAADIVPLGHYLAAPPGLPIGA